MPLAAFLERGRNRKARRQNAGFGQGRDPEGYYELSRQKIAQPTDWSSLEQAFADKEIVVGTVTAVIKGGSFSVDVGVRAFMPASRSGVREAAEMEKLVGQEIRCRIIKLDATEEDVVVDRRALAEERRRTHSQRPSLLGNPRRRNRARHRSAALPTTELSSIWAAWMGCCMWGRSPGTASANLPMYFRRDSRSKLECSRSIPEKRRISLGMKQLQKDPWNSVVEKYKLGERVRGTATRVLEFEAFVELEPGIEGLIHVSEMSWAKKVRIASDVVKPGETVEVVVLGVNPAEHRISLGLKQALGDPWANVAQSFAAGTVIEGPVTSLTKFGAFVQLAEGIEGMIHVSDISAEKRIEYPQDVLKVGQVVKAQVLSLDTAKRLLRLGMKQLFLPAWTNTSPNTRKAML